MDPDIRRIDQYLKRKSCVYTPSWLQECVEYYKSESSGVINFEELCGQVLGQWCLLDLCEVSIPSLPPQLASKAKFQLTGSYTLQVNVAADISTSAFSQYQQLRRADDANLDIDEERRAAGPTEPRGKRMMRLSLTDGLQDVSAVEHQHIKLFDQTLVPGCKVLITGPVISRRGILFLCANNIALLGGEVDSLLVPNALENVVARKLGLPENDDPYRLQLPAAVLNIAAPAAAQDEWGDDLWEQDLVHQLPEILDAADGNQPANNPLSNVGNNANNNLTSSYNNRVHNTDNRQRDNTLPSGHRTVPIHSNVHHRSELPANTSRNNWNDWNAAGRSGADRANAHITPPPGHDLAAGDWSPFPPKSATFTLSDSEDEFLQAVDVEAAIRMTQMVRPTINRTQKQEVVSQRMNQTEDLEEPEFKPSVCHRAFKWEDEDEEMDFEPQTSFPRRHENLSPEREAFYQPSKPRSRQEAFAELRAKRQKGKAVGGPSSAGIESASPEDVARMSGSRRDEEVARPTGSCRDEDFGRDARALRSECFDAEHSEMNVDVKAEPFKSEPLGPDGLEPEPMDTVLDSGQTSRGPRLLGAEPFVYLDAVDPGRPGARHVVKATVLQLQSGLKADAGRWHLEAEITDGSQAALAVRFDNSVLESLIGYSVAEVAAIKRQIATNPLIKERLCEDLQQARQRLVDLNCLMTLEVSEDSVVTVVTLTQVNENHRQSLVQRNSRIEDSD